MTAAILSLNRRTFASLRKHRNYRLFFAGQVVSLTGTWMQRIAQAWLVLALTRSPLAVGILALAQFLPFTVFGLFAGVVVDRLDARRTVLVTQATSMLLASALAAIALAGVARPWHVYAIAALQGCVQVLDAPARQALTYRMVGRRELPNAVALNSSLFNASRILGPAAGGAIIAVAGVGFCFAFNAASFVAVLEQARERPDGRLDRLDLLVVQPLQPGGEPGGPAGAHRAQDALGLVGELDAHAAPVLADRASDETRRLEPCHVLGHARGRHPLAVGELADADPGRVPDRGEHRHLPGGDVERVKLATQVAMELQQNRPQPVRELDRIGNQDTHFQ